MAFRVFRHPEGKTWAIGQGPDNAWKILHGPERRTTNGGWLFTQEKPRRDVWNWRTAELAAQKKMGRGYQEVFPGAGNRFVLVGRHIFAEPALQKPNADLPPGAPSPSASDAERVPDLVAPLVSPSVAAVDLELMDDLGFVPIPF